MPTDCQAEETSADRALLAELAAWLAEAGKLPPPERFDGFCRRLAAAIPLSRISLVLETLHPEDSGIRATWQEGTVNRTQMTRAGIATSSSYLNSPVFVVDQTNAPFRWRQGEPTRDMEVITELAAEGTTEYLLTPLPFQDTTRTAAMSFATREPGGFSERQSALLTQAAALYSPSAERVLLRQIAVGLMATYVGPRAGQQVYEGRIDRGDVETLTAAILFADLRGFTAMSDSLPRTEVIDLLNRWFEVLGDAIDAHGGEILKFLGDGLLAVFRVDGDVSGTCTSALDAAVAARDGTARLAAELVAAGRPPIACGLALHIGEVAFGNIGTRRRLDFTVIGPAVNHASRLQSLTKELGEPVLASAAFAATGGRKLRPLGPHALRGVAEPFEVFAPA